MSIVISSLNTNANLDLKSMAKLAGGRFRITKKPMRPRPTPTQPPFPSPIPPCTPQPPWLSFGYR